jgi:hypothetical protein
MMKMKKIIFVAMTVLIAGMGAIVSAQDAPVLADNVTPVDNNIKLRSVELERIKREAQKSAVLRRENGTELKFSLIKEDFEGIQKEQMKIIEAYTKSKSINYKQISKSSNLITEMAVRLRANVFLTEVESTDAAVAEAEKTTPPTAKSIPELIVALDNAIAETVSSPMWQKLQVVQPDVSKGVEASLIKVIDTSGILWIESSKMRK